MTQEFSKETRETPEDIDSKTKAEEPCLKKDEKSNEDPDMQAKEADLGRRITAAFVDCCVAFFLFLVLGWIGSFGWLSFIQVSHLFWVAPVGYILTRDMYIGENPLGLGKRLAKLDVVCENTNKHPDFIGSIQRNLLFVFLPVSLCMAGLEVYLLIKSPSKKRFGDHFGGTIVLKKSVVS